MGGGGLVGWEVLWEVEGELGWEIVPPETLSMIGPIMKVSCHEISGHEISDV